MVLLSAAKCMTAQACLEANIDLVGREVRNSSVVHRDSGH